MQYHIIVSDLLQNKCKQDCLLQGQAQLDQRVDFCFYTLIQPGGSGWFHYSVNPVPPFEILNSQRVGMPSFLLWKVYLWGGGGVVVCLIIVSSLAQICQGLG